MAAKLRVGQKVRIPNGSEAYIRFIGETDFKEGEWVGLELEEPIGKNNGSVNGTVYFQCEENYGMFMRALPSIEVLEQPKLAAKPAPRPSSVSSRPGAPSVSAGPARTRTSLAPPVTKRMSVVPSSSTAAARRLSNAPAPSTTSSRVSTTSTLASRNPRASLVARSASPKKSVTSTSTPSRPSIAPRAGVRSPPQGSSRASIAIDRVLSPGSSASETQSTGARVTATAPASSTAARPSVQQTKQLEELRTKVQFLEKKLSEDRDQLRKVSGLEEKSTHYENIIQKLQSKCQTFHQENGELKKEAKSLGERVEELEGIHAEHESILELATLDREMAEEKAESFKAELDAIENRLEEMELENEILRDENEELGKDMSPEEKTSQGWLQMQRENDRLRQALLRLRDLSREQEEGLKEDIRNLEEDTKELSQLKEQFETTRVQLLEMESDNEDLREQLDAALGAESMIEQLTDKNLTLGEQIEDLRKTVEHLQDLKELNDELEDNHVDHERQLQEVIDFKETQLTEMIRRTAKQDEDIVDRDYTISRFRELVSTMQSDLEDIRASKEISDLEAHNLEHSSRAIMDMNRQLQASATSATIKAIDIELGKLEATQASDQLSIVQLFVPEAFNTERDSILAYLRFKRVGFKARLLQGFVKQRISESSSTAGSMNTYAACDVLDKLTWMSAISDRFVACIETSNLDQFARFESTLHEVEPVERTLNGYLENLKKDDLQEMVVIDGLQRSIAVMKHLSELYLGSGLETFAEEVLMRALLVQNNLENTATILTAARNDILQFAPPSPNAEDEDSIIFMRNSDSTLTGLRSAKVIAGKLHHVLRDMKVRNLSLSADTLSDFEKCNERSSALLDYFQTLGKAVTNFLHQEDPPVAIEFSTVLIAMRRTSSEYFETKNADTFAPALNNLRGLNDRLADLSNMASDLSQLTEFEKPSPPWILRSKELQDRKAISAVAEEEIKVLKRDIQERATTLKMRQQQLEEAKMKIELLDARNKEANKKLDRIIELEKDIAAAAERERSFEKAMEKQIETAQRLEEERDRWIRRAAEAKAMSGNVQPDGKAGAAAERLIGTSVEMDALKAQIAALQDTNCFLRVQCQRARAEEDAKANSWLSEPLVVSRRNRNPEKDEQRGRYRAVLSNIANLPKAARPLKLSDLPMSPDKEKQTRPKRKAATAKAQLIEQDANWLSAWNPIAMEMKGVPKMPLRIAGMEL